MSESIFCIDERIEQFIADHINPETGELDCPAEELDALQMERDQKVENTAMWWKEQKMLADACRAEIKTLQEKLKRFERNMDTGAYLLTYATGGSKFESAKCSIGFRKSEQVEVNEAVLPKKYLTKKITYAPDKVNLKNLLKQGVKIKGASLIEKQNIQIK